MIAWENLFVANTTQARFGGVVFLGVLAAESAVRLRSMRKVPGCSNGGFCHLFSKVLGLYQFYVGHDVRF
jgi:hypothetical protein